MSLYAPLVDDASLSSLRPSDASMVSLDESESVAASSGGFYLPPHLADIDGTYNPFNPPNLLAPPSTTQLASRSSFVSAPNASAPAAPDATAVSASDDAGSSSGLTLPKPTTDDGFLNLDEDLQSLEQSTQ